MDIKTLHGRLESLKQAIRDQGYPYQVEAAARINWAGDQVSINVRGAKNEFGAPDREKWFHGKAENAENLIEQAAAEIYSWPDDHTLRVERLTRKLGEIAELCEGGANHQDAYQATWEALQQMMRRQQEFITKNGLPAPRDLSNVQTIDAAE